MRLTRKDFQHYGRDYQKRGEQFESFIAAVRQLIESAHIPSLSFVDETPQELRVQYIGHHYAIRYQYTIGQDGQGLGHFASYEVDILHDNKYIPKIQIEIDKLGNMRPVGSETWPWSIHNDSELMFYHLLRSQGNLRTHSSGPLERSR